MPSRLRPAFIGDVIDQPLKQQKKKFVQEKYLFFFSEFSFFFDEWIKVPVRVFTLEKEEQHEFLVIRH